jgi:asparagine N-glycosylation enzyme membrane subunit Stt3
VKRQHLWFCAFALCLVGLCMLLTPADVLAGAQLIDTDAYMRLVRVRLLVESGAWFDASIPRSNWPFGETLHWTRPMDLVLLIGAAPLWPIVGFDQALRWAGLLVPPLLLVATFAATAWAADPIAGRGSRGFVLLVMSTQVIVLSYGQPGRPDHHALILLLFALSLGFLLRGLEKPASVRSAHGLGITAALGMWVSPEFLLPLALFFVGSMGAWVRSGGEAIRFNVGWTRALLIALAACLVIERGAELSAIEYDKISLVHVAVAALALGVWSALARMELGGSVKSVRARAAAGGALGLMSLALMALLFPRFFGGPMVDVTDPVVQSWLHRVAELQPILTPDDARGLGMFLLCAGTTLIAAPYLVASLTRRDESLDGRLLLLAGIVAVLALSLAQLRWVVYVQVMSAVAAADMLGRLTTMLPRARGSTPGATLARASASAVLILGPLGIGAAITSAARPTEPTGFAARCAPEAVATFLAADPDWNDEPRTIAAHTDLGPALLYRSEHRVLATPYHRNEAGIRGMYDLFAATDLEAAEGIVRDREIDLVALCPDRDEDLVPQRVDGRPSLFGRLMDGEGPEWLVEVDLPEESGSARLFRIEPSDLPSHPTYGTTQGGQGD